MAAYTWPQPGSVLAKGARGCLVMQFLAMIEVLRPLRVGEVGATELMAASALLRRYSDQDLTLVDAVGLYLMDEMKVRQCWSMDFHLGLGGASLVIKQH
jgi:predicted nucleic acid-binding protein